MPAASEGTLVSQADRYSHHTRTRQTAHVYTNYTRRMDLANSAFAAATASMRGTSVMEPGLSYTYGYSQVSPLPKAVPNCGHLFPHTAANHHTAPWCSQGKAQLCTATDIQEPLFAAWDPGQRRENPHPAPPPPWRGVGGILHRGAHRTMERLSKIAGTTSRYRSAAATRGSASAWGIECMVANTHGVLHPREISQQSQLARGNGITPEAFEAGRPGNATKSARSDCRTGGEGLRDSVHGRIVETNEPQGHAQSRGIWRVRGRRGPRTRGALLWLRTNTSQANK